MRLIKTLCLALLTLSTFGCGGVSEAEKGIQDLLFLMDQMTAAIERNDEKEMLRLAEEMKAHGQKMKALKPRPEEEQALKEKYAATIKQSGEKLMGAAMKNPKLLPKFKEMGNPFGKL